MSDETTKVSEAAKPEAAKPKAKKQPRTSPKKTYKIQVEGVKLANNPAEIKAGSSREAWAKFCVLNNIVDTDKPKTITEVE